MSHHEETTALLRERGCRVTPQRLLILDVLRRSREHLSAEDVHSQVTARFPGIDLSTVYRSLELFSGFGLVRQTNLGSDRVHYEWSDDPDHHHLICQGCGRVLHADGDLLAGIRTTLERDYGFRPIEVRLTVLGRCQGCR